MKAVVACSLFLLGVYGCQRVCGDMQPIAEAEPAGGGGAGGEQAVTAGEGGEGGAGSIPLMPPGGMSGEGGGGASGASGATSDDTCPPPPSAEITDFEDAPASPALGEMMSDDEGPTGVVEQVMDPNLNLVYREQGELPEQPPDQANIGFSLTFNSCFDASSYTGIRFDARGITPSGLDVSIVTNSASEPGSSTHRDVDSMGGPLEVCFPPELDQRTLRELRFIYTAGDSTGSTVDLFLDNFVFVAGDCTGT